MLAAAGGGGAGGTPWGMLTVQQMQTLIQNPDTEKHYELLTGWKQSADLLVEHRWQVQNYRDNLASVWPPERNAASAAYIARLDELIANLNETYEAAISNHDAFAAATLSISLAQKDMDELAREYESNEQLLLAHATQQQQAAAQPQPSPSPSGEQPPVAPGRQAELHQKAVTLLSGVSAELASAQFRIRTPKLYQPAVKIENDSNPNDGVSHTPPPIPPVTPSFGNDGQATQRSSRPSVAFPTAPVSATPITSPNPAHQPGLVLGGATPPVLTPPVSTTPVVSTPGSPNLPPGVPSPVFNPGVLPPAAGSVRGGGGIAPLPTNPGLGRGGGLLRDGVIHSSPPAGGARVQPAPGVIGGPGYGTGQPSSSRSPARVNPVGGVIDGPAGGAPNNRGLVNGRGLTNPSYVNGVGPSIASAGGRVTRRGDEPEDKHWDPDNPWVTAKGVNPILLPSQEKTIDPGPAIGLD